MKIFNLRKIKDRGHTLYKNEWIEFHPEFSMANLRIEKAGYFDERPQVSFTITTVLAIISLLISPFVGFWFAVCSVIVLLFIPWGQVYANLPIKTGIDECESPTWGFYFYGEGLKIPDNLVICKGKKTKFIYLPWSYTWVRTSALRKDGEWEHETKGARNKDFWDDEKWNGILFKETHPYLYTLNSGEQQNILATIRVDEREWRPIWFKWTSLFAKKRRSIDINFNSEVGERTGSWKGGTVGCSYEMKHKETPFQCLMRMENERTFS